ncbi:MAG: flagellar basal body-associated FliL family protein [Lachnospiraceae bacterium]|nr:flagellar basal body-associated FliL family protein [Lachnospiraceae bacterium]MCM1257424.1 flagellar basal body-associated FliL family protein [Roseburia sp.]
MKKNLITMMVLALVLVNLVLTAILTITIVPQTKKANELITQVCSAINLELQSGATTSDIGAVPIDKLATYSIADSMTINFKDNGDGVDHLVVLTVTISMNTEADGYKEYGDLAAREDLIKDTINRVIGSHTYDEFKADEQKVRNSIVEELHNLFGSSFIVGVSFPQMTYQ